MTRLAALRARIAALADHIAATVTGDRRACRFAQVTHEEGDQ